MFRWPKIDYNKFNDEGFDCGSTHAHTNILAKYHSGADTFRYISIHFDTFADTFADACVGKCIEMYRQSVLRNIHQKKLPIHFDTFADTCIGKCIEMYRRMYRNVSKCIGGTVVFLALLEAMFVHVHRNRKDVLS